jgi:hypothetical protein
MQPGACLLVGLAGALLRRVCFARHEWALGGEAL